MKPVSIITIKIITFIQITLILCLTIVNTVCAMTPEEILKDIRRRNGLGNGSYSIELKMTAYRNQDVSNANIKVYTSGNKQIVTFTAPEKLTDESYLVNGYNTWMYQQGLKRPIRISAQQKLFGDAGIAEAAGIDYANDYQVVRSTETDLQYQYELKAIDNRTAYQQAGLWIDKNGLLLNKVVLKALNGQPLKEIIYRNHRQLNGHEIADMEVRNLLQEKDNRTIMEYTAITSREIPDKAFDPLMMGKLQLLIKE